jgi:hypothetical protein
MRWVPFATTRSTYIKEPRDGLKGLQSLYKYGVVYPIRISALLAPGLFRNPCFTHNNTFFVARVALCLLSLLLFIPVLGQNNIVSVMFDGLVVSED